MKVRIVCYEDTHLWILGKFALKLEEQLLLLGIDCDIAKIADPKADINHHIIFHGYNGKPSSIDTIMITHIDTEEKLFLIDWVLKNSDMGICMSEETVALLGKQGINKEKLCFINPAHDGVIVPRPIVFGITSKTHSDGRKKEHWLVEISKSVDVSLVKFVIMGSGWDISVDLARKNGLVIDYYPQFEYNLYSKLVPTFDYYIYMTFDEGSMGFLDALNAGVKTIVTPQGFHLDVLDGITHPVNNIDEIISTINNISSEKRKRINSVAEWTWANYAQKHVTLWSQLIKEKSNFLITNEISKERKINPTIVSTSSRLVDSKWLKTYYSFKRIQKKGQQHVRSFIKKLLVKIGLYNS